MATQELPAFDELITELARLEREERELSAARKRLHDRLDLGFPNELTAKRERQISDERLALHQRIDHVRAQLGLFAPRP